jgi:hypothetical protein
MVRKRAATIAILAPSWLATGNPYQNATTMATFASDAEQPADPTSLHANDGGV